jgi:hypothetical protein
MGSGKGTRRFFVGLGVVLLQLFMIQVVTFLFSLVLPGLGPQMHPVLFVAVLGVTFSSGIFLAGWLALGRRWLSGEPRHVTRLVATLVGSYLPLIVALALLGHLEAGSPFFVASMVTGILGFHAPGWSRGA